MNHNVASKIIDVLVQEDDLSYSALLRLMAGTHRFKVGVTLHELIKEGIIHRTHAGRYYLSKDSKRALAA